MRYKIHIRLLPVLAFLPFACQAAAQTTPPRTIDFRAPPAPDQAALARHDLAWIRTGNDFDQHSMDVASVDREIGRRLGAYDRETSIVTMDVPINRNRLAAPAQHVYKDFEPRAMKLRNQPGDTRMYVWRYDDVDVLVAGDSPRDQLNVYATARALEILRHRYPKAYQTLFVEPRQYAGIPPMRSFVNRFDRIMVVFDSTTDASVAESGSALGQAIGVSAPVPHQQWSNAAVIAIDSENILGGSFTGSRPLYRAGPEENNMRYLREGLVETLVHEMLHRVIDTKRNLDPLATLIAEARFGRPLNSHWEEVFITNTSLTFFQKHGGLQAPIPYYYRGIMDGNIAVLHAHRLTGLADDMSRLPGFTGLNFLDVMRLPWLD